MSLANKKQALSKGKPLGRFSKTSPPKKEKDTTAFYGDARATRQERMSWLRKNKNLVYRLTKGRVTESKLSEYEKKLSGFSRWGPDIEKYKREPERMEIAMKKAIDKAKASKKFDEREDMEVAKRMFGLGKK
jgi:hypothetical protein